MVNYVLSVYFMLVIRSQINVGALASPCISHILEAAGNIYSFPGMFSM